MIPWRNIEELTNNQILKAETPEEKSQHISTTAELEVIKYHTISNLR